MRKRAFTLVELLTVVSIIAILYAILLPVVKTAKGAAFQYNAAQGIRQLGTGTAMYASDSDDTAPIAMYMEPDGIQAWFGFRNKDGSVDKEAGLLAPYGISQLHKDPAHEAHSWFGDGSGYGYNWGHIGSDAHETDPPGSQVNLENPAHLSQLMAPSDTIGYATSAFFFAPWIPGGDGNLYDCGFIYQNRFWHGNPPIDFRHQGHRVVDLKLREVRNEGNALIVFMDGHVKAMKQGQIKDGMFMRTPPEP